MHGGRFAETLRDGLPVAGTPESGDQIGVEFEAEFPRECLVGGQTVAGGTWCRVEPHPPVLWDPQFHPGMRTPIPNDRGLAIFELSGSKAQDHSRGDVHSAGQDGECGAELLGVAHVVLG